MEWKRRAIEITFPLINLTPMISRYTIQFNLKKEITNCRNRAIFVVAQCSSENRNSQKELGVCRRYIFLRLSLSRRKQADTVALPIVAVSGRVELCASSEFQRKPAGRTITHFSTVA